jgi:hypothetical protein
MQESPIYQLQVTFAALQCSNAASFNPIKLVESLKIRASEQQDAQESVDLNVLSYAWLLTEIKVLKAVSLTLRGRVQETGRPSLKITDYHPSTVFIYSGIFGTLWWFTVRG